MREDSIKRYLSLQTFPLGPWRKKEEGAERTRKRV